jgi:tetratricopeptide (TPR) repeat protein
MTKNSTPVPAPAMPRWKITVAAAVLALGALAAYSNTFNAPFVYDDKPSILENTTLHQFSTALSPPAGGITVDGRPLLNLSFAINYALGGLNPWGYHALNLLLHAAAGLVLLGLVRRTLEQPVLRDRFRGAALPIAFVVAALWTLHPLQTEAVTYVVQRAESLMGLLLLFTLYGFVRSVQSVTPARWLVASAGTCLLGMAVKENMVAAPVLVLLYDRTFAAGSFRAAWRSRRTYYLALAATWLLLAGLVLGGGGNRGGSRGFGLGLSWWEYELTQFPVVMHYLVLSIWPRPLVFEYGPLWVHQASEAILPAVVTITLAAGTLYGLRRNTAAGFLGAWFFVILAPTSLLPAATQMIVEHRMYLPLAAVIALLVVGVYRISGRNGLAALVALGCVLGGLTHRRNHDYRTEVDLWQDTVNKSPDNLTARGSLGAALAQAGRIPEAIAEDEASIRIQPNYLAFNNLGSALISAGRPADAVPRLEESIRLNPAYPDAQLNLGVALELLKRPREALPHYEMALQLNPTSPQACNNLGDSLSRAGRAAEGIAQLEKALQLKPDYLEARFNLAAALARAGRMPEAQAQFEAGLALKPDDGTAYLNWCNVLFVTGHPAEGVAQYTAALQLHPSNATLHYNYGSVLAAEGGLGAAQEEFTAALRLRPDYAEAHNNLGNTLTLLRREAEALPHYEAALRLSPDNPVAHNNLGLALARLGRIQEAATQFAAAVQLAPDYAEARENLAHAKAQLRGEPQN